MIIGREEQLDQLRRAIARATTTDETGPNVLFVTGEAGIGKTTLLRSARAGCETMTPQPLAIHVECSTPLAGQDIGEVESLGPWEEILRRLVAAQPKQRDQTRKLVADLAKAWIRCIPVVGDVLESVADTAQIVRDHSR
jgi:predicted ATPase